jgi:hypothetical protein
LSVPLSAFALQSTRRELLTILKFWFRVRTPNNTYILVEAGTQRYNVGTDTPKLCATSLGGVPEESNLMISIPKVFRVYKDKLHVCTTPADLKEFSANLDTNIKADKNWLQIGRSTYNSETRGFDEPWPFGPEANPQ